MSITELLKEAEARGMNVLPMLDEIDDKDLKHAVRDLVSSVQAIRHLAEREIEIERLRRLPLFDLAS